MAISNVGVIVAKTAVLVVGGLALHGVRKGTELIYGRMFDDIDHKAIEATVALNGAKK